MSTKKLLANLKKGKAYRDGYVASLVNLQVPLQVRALRKKRNWDQAKLAQEANMAQPRISLIEKLGHGNVQLDTLVRIASALDVGLIVKFAPFSELVGWSEGFSPDTFDVPSFEKELPRLESEVHISGPISSDLKVFTVIDSGTAAPVMEWPALVKMLRHSSNLITVHNQIKALGEEDDHRRQGSLREIAGYERPRIQADIRQHRQRINQQFRYSDDPVRYGRA